MLVEERTWALVGTPTVETTSSNAESATKKIDRFVDVMTKEPLVIVVVGV